MPISVTDRLAVSRLRHDAGMLSTTTLASGGGLQTESVDDDDAAVFDLWVDWLHQERAYRPAPTASFHTHVLPLGLDCGHYSVLDFPQHALVSVRFVSPGWFCELAPELATEAQRPGESQ